jgi:hypothetical protein
MLTEIFYKIDNFSKNFQKEWSKYLLAESTEIISIKCQMSLSEIMTIAVYFHLSGYRTFKHYYQNYVCRYLTKEFPRLVSYNRFVEIMQSSLIPMLFYLRNFRKGKCSGISFIDSTKLVVCHNRRINQHKMFKDLAGRGKDSVGWFYGFKLHLIINEHGEIINFTLTPGNTDDRNRAVFSDLTKEVFGKLFGDRGYVSEPLVQELFEDGIQLIAKLRKNMKSRLLPIFDKILLRKRAVIESVNDELKNICQIEHSRHRSIHNFLVNLLSGLIAYSFKPHKPSINFNQRDLSMLGNLPAIVL